MTTVTALKVLYRMVQGRRNFCGPSSPLLKQGQLEQTTFTWLLNTTKDGESTASWGNL